MGTHFLYLKSCFSFVDERFFSEFLYRTMFRYGHYLWVSLCNFMLNVFWFTAKYMDRGKADHKSQKNCSKFNANHSQEDGKLVSKSSMDFNSDFATEKESSNLSYSLLSQESTDSKEVIAETENSVFLQSGINASTRKYKESTDSKEMIAETKNSAFPQSGISASMRKYQFMAGEDVRGFMEQPEIISFTIQEMFVDSKDGLISNGQNSDGRVLQDQDEDEMKSSSEVQELDRCSNASTMEEEREENSFETPFNEEIDDDISYEVHLLPRNEFSTSDLKPKLESSYDGLFAGNHEVQSGINVAPSSEIFASINPMISSDDRKPEIIERSSSEKEVINGNSCTVREGKVHIEDEYIKLVPLSKDTNKVHETILSQKDENLIEVPHTGGRETQLMDEGSQGFQEESLVKESSESDSDDEDEFDILLEHQELVKQMKMERKNSKINRGLPTISENEECETPRGSEDLKPLKIDEKFEYKDLMEEIQKFYKSYAEKMRKLDILNYQTLHAISFLQLKDSQLFMPSEKSLLSTNKPFSLPSISLPKQRRIYADPTLKSITEMHRDLELVYVGQICLSWEILHWQYGKVKELEEYDSQGHHSYNQVAGEYQQFQVLVQRFLEDERFNGPRIQNFVKSRCFCRGLLQVPIIKDDCCKEKKEIKGDEIDTISISMLAETIKDSMHIFWEFLRADKEEANGVLKSSQGSLVDHQAAVDSELLMNVRTCLEKKERKLKDMHGIGNCIVKKFQKHLEVQPSNALLISQVELKLVSRVLSLSRLTTDHLIWCQKKLDNIIIVKRKIHVEPAFVLFPC